MADAGAEWVVERGIGEDRALLIENERILAAKLHWHGELFCGQRLIARLTTKKSGARRGTATGPSGEDILVDHLPVAVTEGQTIPIEISRASVAEGKRQKLAQGRYTPDASGDPVQWFASAKSVPAFAPGLWDDVWQTAQSGDVAFDGGMLTFSVTPAMTLIDVDGDGSPLTLSLAAIPAIASWVQRFDLGGNIGIDFPTIESKKERKALDDALASALADWPHERTAMNGFGFVQIVARMEGPSLLHRAQISRTGLCARYALRLAERTPPGGGTTLLTVHPAIQAKLKPDWIEELRRRTGREVRIATDPALALEAPSAQIVAA